MKKFFQRLLKKKVGILIFFTPVFFFGLYFYVIARDRYIVSSELVIRKAKDNMDSGFNFSSFLGSGNLSSREDAKFLKSYLKSPQILNLAEKNLNFVSKYSKKNPDIITGIFQDSNIDKRYSFFKKVVFITYKESSNILKIETIGYDPNTAFLLNKLLISNSEKFANELNQDIFKKQLSFVSNQVKIKADEVAIASKNLLDYQRSNNIFEPLVEGKNKSAFLSGLEGELVKLKLDLAMFKRRFVSSDAPEIIDTSNQILELSRQINEERSNLINPNGDNLNLKILKVSEYENSLKFALDLYMAAIKTYEQTKINSLQQQRFIAIISEPVIPEESSDNWKHRGFFSAFGILIILFGLYNFFKNLAYGRRS